MADQRPFRFGVQLAAAASGGEWAETARKVEGLGYSSLHLPDHFGDQLAPLPAITAAAAATTDLRVGILVLGNDYRHPVVLAKELATIDVLSDGRLEAGIGAGWMNTDYDQSGIPHDPPGRRIERLQESITILKGLFGEGHFSFDGEHYVIAELDGLPKPVQEPWPPIMIGGGGRRVLRLAAREADIVSINPRLRSGDVDAEAAADATALATDQKLDWVREAAGDRFDDIELSMLVLVAAVTDDRDGFAEVMAGGFGVDPEAAKDVPHAWFGTVDEICDSLESRRERWGVTYYVVQGDTYEAMAPVVERLAGR